MKRSTGQTKDMGFQFGIRKTFTVSLVKTWGFMFSKNGLEVWLGDMNGELALKEEYQTKEGISGVVKVFNLYSHIRMTWQKKNWENISSLQVRIIGNQEKTTISIHQEKLADAEQREEMKQYWTEVMEKIANHLQ